MIIRPATPEDAAHVAAIQNPVIRETSITFNAVEKTPEDLAQIIQSSPCFHVAVLDGRVVGFAHYFQFRGGVGYARTMEHTIVLAPEARGHGAGRDLMEALFDQARADGIGSLWAGVSGENPDGVAFHAKLGFEVVASLPKVGFKFDRWMDLVLMRKWLGDADKKAD